MFNAILRFIGFIIIELFILFGLTRTGLTGLELTAWFTGIQPLMILLAYYSRHSPLKEWQTGPGASMGKNLFLVMRPVILVSLSVVFLAVWVNHIFAPITMASLRAAGVDTQATVTEYQLYSHDGYKGRILETDDFNKARLIKATIAYEKWTAYVSFNWNDPRYEKLYEAALSKTPVDVRYLSWWPIIVQVK